MLTHRDMLRASSSAYGSRLAIRTPSGAISHAELDRLTDAAAQGLLGSGLVPGDRVAWLAMNRPEFFIAYLATAKAGLAFSPLNYWLRPAELAGLIDLIGPRAVIAAGDYRDLLDGLELQRAPQLRIGLDGAAPGWITWDGLLDTPGSLTRVPNDEHALHEIIFTSGTTGQAKGVMRSQRKRILEAMASALAFRINRDDHLVYFGPQFHIGGFSSPNHALHQGGAMGTVVFDPEAAAAVIARGATYLLGVPTHFNLLIESGVLDAVDTSRVTACHVGGAPATRSFFERVSAAFPNVELVQGYGSTESSPNTLAIRGAELFAHPGSVGLPTPGTEVRVLGAEGAAVDVDEVGELHVRSASVMDGYLDRPELTAAVLSEDGWFATGDLVSRDAEGWFSIVGRARDMIITGGENVYPAEVEDVLVGHASVIEAAVLGVPDAVYGERVVALIRVVPGQEAVDPEDVRAWVRERVAGFKTPKQIHVVEDFPRTPVGKIAKFRIVEELGSLLSR